MNAVARSMIAQAQAELKIRMRSPATLVAMALLLVASSAWIPDPATGMVSVSWKSMAGQVVSGTYGSAYIGIVAALLASIILSLAGFHLVAGSIRRDRDSGVGRILAATPLSSGAYLVGKFSAHLAYLLVLAGVTLATGALAFVRFGAGAFSAADFVLTFILIVIPAVAFAAAMAVLFDVTPGLGGRAGQVVYFFTWLVLVLMIPTVLQGELPGQKRRQGLPLYDPQGAVAVRNEIYASMADVKRGSISMGLQRPSSVERVSWPAAAVTTRLATARAVAVVWIVVPLGLALIAFDRFDPAAARGPSSRRPGPAPVATEVSAPTERSGLTWRGLATQPAAMRAVFAEVRLIWDTASWLKWPLLASAVAGAASLAATHVFLLFVAPVIAETAARETRAGTIGLVFSAAGVPSPRVLWKAAAIALFCLGLGLPALLRAFAVSSAHGVALLTGLLFIAAFSTSAASLSGGGKTFLGLYTPLWYLSLNGAPMGAFDFAGLRGSGLGISTRLAYVGASALGLGLALAVERWRRRA
jgi:hypothetical protein